ncbi:hypothetical protein HY522_03330 [bacterium]|nr:hypothetical protein [bacterium]
MNEADTCRTLITPALQTAGWDRDLLAFSNFWTHFPNRSLQFQASEEAPRSSAHGFFTEYLNQLAGILMLSAAMLSLPSVVLGAEPDSFKSIRDAVAFELDRRAAGPEAVQEFDSECAAAYGYLQARDTLTLSIFLGFMNSMGSDLVMDGAFRSALVDHLKKDCAGPSRACGFKETNEDHPPAPGHPVTLSMRRGRVVLNIYNSSIGENDSERAGRQEDHSRAVTEAYLDALRRDDVVLYLGHSRYGTGPGFRPRGFFSREGLTTFLHRPLAAEMAAALGARAAPPVLLGFFSCQSQKHYARLIHSSSPRSALIVTSGLTSHLANLLGLRGFLDAFLGMRCREEMEKNLNAKIAPSAYHIYGFFEESPHPRYRPRAHVLAVSLAILAVPFLVAFLSGFGRSLQTFPAAPASGAAPCRIALFISVLPAVFIARPIHVDTLSALPLMISLTGVIILLVSLFRGAEVLGRLWGFVKRTRMAAGLSAVLYFLVIFLPEINPMNAAGAFRQSLAFLAAAVIILPFVFCSGELLLVPFLGRDWKHAVHSGLVTLAFYALIHIGLSALNPDFNPSRARWFAFVLYQQAASLLLHRRTSDPAAPLAFQWLTLAWIFSEQMQSILYG